MWDLPGPGLKPVSPALAGGFLTTVPPGKSLHTYEGVYLPWKGPPMLFSLSACCSLTHKISQDRPYVCWFQYSFINSDLEGFSLYRILSTFKTEGISAVCETQNRSLQSRMLTTYFPVSPTFKYNFKINECVTNTFYSHYSSKKLFKKSILWIFIIP